MILVAGATGNTGAEIVKGLTAKGFAFRAMVRDANASSFPASVEIVQADFDDASLG